MSYAAVISIAVLNAPLSRTLAFVPSFVRSDIATVLAAQIGVFPLSVLFFGYVSWISAYINLIIIPLISVIFVFLALSVLLSLITAAYGFFAFLPNILVNLLNDFVSEADYSVFVFPVTAGGALTCVYYAGVLLASDVLNLKFTSKAFICTAAITIYVVFSQLFTYGVL